MRSAASESMGAFVAECETDIPFRGIIIPDVEQVFNKLQDPFIVITIR